MRTHDLEIANGTSCQARSTLWRPTSYQAMGTSVIDYCLAPERVLTDCGLILHVNPHKRRWSDHAMLHVALTVPHMATSESQANTGRDGAPPPRTMFGPLTELDTVLAATLAYNPSLDDRIAAFYGRAHQPSGGGAQQVYTDGCCLRPGTPSARSGAGVYHGPSSVRNIAQAVPGDQTNNRGELYAALLAIRQAEPCRLLRIYTDSTYTIHSVCHWAPINAAAGWKCKNADILKNIVSLIRRRFAPLSMHSGSKVTRGTCTTTEPTRRQTKAP